MVDENTIKVVAKAKLAVVDARNIGVEKSFERRRGIGQVVLKDGYAQVHISDFAVPVHPMRLKVLEMVKNAEINIQLLKLTPSGLTYLVSEANAQKLNDILAVTAFHFTIKKGRSIVEIHAVNMRDEEGLIAKVVASAIASGAKMEHIGDMHDRLIITASNDDAQRIAGFIESENLEVDRQ